MAQIISQSASIRTKNPNLLIAFRIIIDEIININLPSKVELKVVKPGFRGNTATNATKPAIMETDLEVQVPLFINEGDILKIDTKSGNYSERLKS